MEKDSSINMECCQYFQRCSRNSIFLSQQPQISERYLSTYFFSKANGATQGSKPQGQQNDTTGLHN